MGKNYFETVCEIISSSDRMEGFDVDRKGEFAASFCKGDVCYSLEYDSAKSLICIFSVSESEKKTVSSWLMEFDRCTSKDVNMIADDFIRVMAGDSAKKTGSVKTKKNGESNDSITGLFFANRMGSMFPELKEIIQNEKNRSGDVKIATFTQENVLPCVREFLAGEKNKSRINKFGKMLSDLYHTGGLDVRSVITMGLLCGLDENAKESESLRDALSEELKKAWAASLKYKGKQVKPEKVKTRKSFMSKLLEAQKNIEK